MMGRPVPATLADPNPLRRLDDAAEDGERAPFAGMDAVQDRKFEA